MYTKKDDIKPFEHKVYLSSPTMHGEEHYEVVPLGETVGSGEDSLFKFKRAFYRGELCRYYIGKKIFVKKVYKELVGIRGNIDHSHFFPEYRGE